MTKLEKSFLAVIAGLILLVLCLTANLQKAHDKNIALQKYYLATERLLDRITECDYPEFYDTTGESDEYCDYFVALKSLK